MARKRFGVDLGQGNLFGLRLDLNQKETINGGKGRDTGEKRNYLFCLSEDGASRGFTSMP